MSFSVLPLDIERVEIRFGLKLPLSTIPALLHKDELRVNVPCFIHWCQVCQCNKVHYFCKTEDRWVCAACNGFCENKVHQWEKAWETIGVK